MARRRTNPDTGEPQLTYREQMFVNEYLKNGGNAKQAAIAAGYGSARAEQSAYQVLHRLQVQQHIRDRVSESVVSADEIIGTLASFMRGNITQFLDDNGDFDIKAVRKRGLGHLLKTVSRTTRKGKSRPGQPPEFAQTYRIQLHSPVQAASVLARLKGLNRKTSDLQAGHIAAEDDLPGSPGCFTGSPAGQSTQPDSLPPTIPDILDPRLWMEALIKHEMQLDGRSRSEVVETILQLRPEAARYILPDPELHDSGIVTPANAQTDADSIAAPGSNAANTPSAPNGSRQHSVSQELKRIRRTIRYLKKINTNQYLESGSAQPSAPSPRPDGRREVP